MNLSLTNQTLVTHLLTDVSCPERSLSTAAYVLLYVCASAAVLLTVCGNLLVIISVCHFKQLHTPTNMLVLSLALLDFMVGGLVMPAELIFVIESCWIFGPVVCISFVVLSYFLTSSSVHNVAIIAVDRYLALSRPFLYTERVSVCKMCTVITCDWSVLLIYNLLLHYFNGHLTGVIACPGDSLFVSSDVWPLVDLLFVFVFPCSVIVIFYLLVFVIARKHATAIRALRNNHTKTAASKNLTDAIKTERKAAKVLGILVCVFLACLLPYYVYTFISNSIETESYHIVVIISLFNSTINPFIYALFYPWFRRCLKIIITLQIFKRHSAWINVNS